MKEEVTAKLPHAGTYRRDEVWNTFFAPLLAEDKKVEHIKWLVAQLNCGDDSNNNSPDAHKDIETLLTKSDDWLVHEVYGLVCQADWQPTQRFRDRINTHLTDKYGREPSSQMETAICSLAAGIENWMVHKQYNGGDA